MGVYDQIKQAIQDFVAPEIQSLRGDIRALNEKIDGVDAKLSLKLDELDARLTIKIDSFRSEMISELRRVDTRIDGLDKRMDGFGRELGLALEVRERLAALEARRSS